MESQPESLLKRKTNLLPLMKTLKNSGDLSGRARCSSVLQTARIRGYIGRRSRQLPEGAFPGILKQIETRFTPEQEGRLAQIASNSGMTPNGS